MVTFFIKGPPAFRTDLFSRRRVGPGRGGVPNAGDPLRNDVTKTPPPHYFAS